MLTVLLILAAVAAVPLLARVVRALFLARAFLIALFLPAGLLLRFGLSEDLHLFVLVTFVWGVVLTGWLRSRRARPAQRPARPA